MKYFYFLPTILVMFFFSCTKDSENREITDAEDLSSYDRVVLADNPVGYWLLNLDDLADASIKKHDGHWNGNVPESQTMPNGEKAIFFNGIDAYYEIADVDHLEVSTAGVLTIEAWMSPGVNDFPSLEADKDYIHWMGKGAANQHSWTARMYNKDSFRENRPQRISGYAFNLAGGLGAGSYFQDVITPGTWVHYVLVINTNHNSSSYPTGYTKLYRDGVLRDQDDLKSYNIVPENGSAPIRIGTRDFASFFKGSIAKVAIYDYELTVAAIAAHYNAMK